MLIIPKTGGNGSGGLVDWWIAGKLGKLGIMD